MEIREEAGQAAEVMAHFVMDADTGIQEFVRAMNQEHRTLQQNFTRLCLAWLYHLAELEEGDYDLRNEASVLAAREVKAVLGEHGQFLPFV